MEFLKNELTGDVLDDGSLENSISNTFRLRSWLWLDGKRIDFRMTSSTGFSGVPSFSEVSFQILASCLTTH